MYRLLLLLLFPTLALAQTTAAVDVILRTDGEEVPGRVLGVSPWEVAYVPLTGADTLRLAAAAVFMVRYADGARQLLHPAAAPTDPADPLAGLNTAQRSELGRADVVRGFPDRGTFGGTLATTLVVGPVFGLLGPVLIGTQRVPDRNLLPPNPALLADPAYGAAYRQQAQRRKRERTWGGYLLGALVWTAAFSLLTE